MLSSFFIGPVHFVEGMLLFGGVGRLAAILLFWWGPETRDVDLARYSTGIETSPAAGTVPGDG